MTSRNYFIKASVLFVIASFTACSTGPRKQTYWINPSFGPELQQQRFTLDSTECVALANQMIPEPLPPQQPQTQKGNITLHTPSGPVFGSYQSRSSVPQSQPSGFRAGYERAEREQNRQNYAVACMGNRGWQQRERTVNQ